jgi:hypothetical protein
VRVKGKDAPPDPIDIARGADLLDDAGSGIAVCQRIGEGAGSEAARVGGQFRPVLLR